MSPDRAILSPRACMLVVYPNSAAKRRTSSAVLSLILRSRHVPLSTALTVDGDAPASLAMSYIVDFRGGSSIPVNALCGVC